MTIHKNYNLLNSYEKEFVDSCIEGIFAETGFYPEIFLNNGDPNNGDPVEQVAESIATWVIKSKNSLLNNGKM